MAAAGENLAWGTEEREKAMEDGLCVGEPDCADHQKVHREIRHKKLDICDATAFMSLISAHPSHALCDVQNSLRWLHSQARALIQWGRWFKWWRQNTLHPYFKVSIPMPRRRTTYVMTGFDAEYAF
eukprot:1240447-Rhodomonas_salina.2